MPDKPNQETPRPSYEGTGGNLSAPADPHGVRRSGHGRLRHTLKTLRRHTAVLMPLHASNRRDRCGRGRLTTCCVRLSGHGRLRRPHFPLGALKGAPFSAEIELYLGIRPDVREQLQRGADFAERQPAPD